MAESKTTTDENISSNQTSELESNPTGPTTIIYKTDKNANDDAKATISSNSKEESVKSVWQEMESEKQLRESYGNDRVALSVVSALFMTASIAALAVPPSDFYESNNEDTVEWAMYIYSTAHTVVIGSCVSTIFTGTWQYLKLNMAPAVAVDEMVLALSSYHPLISEPVIYCFISMVALGVGVVDGVYLVYGTTSFWISFGIMALFEIQVFVTILCAERAFEEIVEGGKFRER